MNISPSRASLPLLDTSQGHCCFSAQLRLVSATQVVQQALLLLPGIRGLAKGRFETYTMLTITTFLTIIIVLHVHVL